MPKSVTQMSEEKAINLFSGMILQGKIRQAVRFITDRSETGGILCPDDDAGTGKTVQEVLESKHPEQREPDPEAFIICEDLPVLIDVDVMADHMLKKCKYTFWWSCNECLRCCTKAKPFIQTRQSK